MTFFTEGQVFQFFVRATDLGQPPKHSDVPINILIMGPKDLPPIFERKDDKFFFAENSPTGNIITKEIHFFYLIIFRNYNYSFKNGVKCFCHIQNIIRF